MNLAIGGLTIEFTMLVVAIVLGAVHLLAAAQAITAERGLWWNMGPRDNTPPLKSALAGRLDRAFANFRETFPFFAALLLGSQCLAGITGSRCGAASSTLPEVSSTCRSTQRAHRWCAPLSGRLPRRASFSF